MHDDKRNEQPPDPWEVLGVPADASEETLRQAYLDKLRQYPPDRAPEEFERIRDAYQAARTPGMRVRRLMAADDPRKPLTSLVEQAGCGRAFAGPKPWMAVIKEK